MKAFITKTKGKLSGTDFAATSKKYNKQSSKRICEICGAFSSTSRLKDHMAKHSEERNHRCDTCGKCFKIRSALSAHKLTHSEVAKYKCPTCGKAFKVPFNLRVHMRTHMEVKPFGCEFCNKTFTTKQWRNNHVNTHLFKTQRDRCAICNETFYSKSHKKRHEKNLEAFVTVFCKPCDTFVGLDESKFHHSSVSFCMLCHDFLYIDSYDVHPCFHKKSTQKLANEKRLYCKYCKQMFFWPKHIEAHEKDCYNPDSISLICRCCKASFLSLKELHEHTSLLCETKLTDGLVCVFCEIKFETLTCLKSHINFHHSNDLTLPSITRKSSGESARKKAPTQIPCRFCNSTFKNKNWAISHERKQHGSELVKCEICSEDIKMEKAKSHYVSHRLHEKYKNTPEKVCNVCGVKIKNLDSHMVRHEEERRYRCNLCIKTFKLHWDLKRHMLVHTNEARHICQVCGKCFKVGYNLTVHMRSHEVVKPFRCMICEKTFTTKQWRDNHLNSHHKF